MEKWKDIPGYEGLYQASTEGRVKSLDRVVEDRDAIRRRKFKERILKLILGGSGYFHVDLSKEGIEKNFKVSQLVAMAFLGHKRCGHKIVVDHIDNNRSNDFVENLQLISHRENTSKDKKSYSSEYTGVCWSKASKKWHSQIQINGKICYLGQFENELHASKAYQTALKDVLQD
jgi:hypothetical protein